MFYKLKCAMARFMYGRNGMDQLNRALFWGYLILWAAGYIVTAVLKNQILSAVFNGAMWLLLVYLLFRMFSRDLTKRRQENQKWVTWQQGFRSKSAGAKARHADKDHKYFTCKSCKAICRVPVGKGKIIITCPKCGGKIEAKT